MLCLCLVRCTESTMLWSSQPSTMTPVLLPHLTRYLFSSLSMPVPGKWISSHVTFDIRLVGSSSTTMPSQSTPAKAAKVRSCSPSKLQNADIIISPQLWFIESNQYWLLNPLPHKNRACIEWLPGTVTSCWRSPAKTLKRLNWKTHWIRSLNESWI